MDPVSGSLVSNAARISPSDLETLSGDILLMKVSADRAQILDKELMDQAKAIQAKNDQMRQLNDISAWIAQQKALFNSTDNEAWVANQDAYKKLPADRTLTNGRTVPSAYSDAAKLWEKAGITEKGPDGYAWTVKVADAYFQYKDFTAMETLVKSKTDSLSSSVQMDMIRLQALSNRRDESYTTITNLLKKLNDSISGILGNLR